MIVEIGHITPSKHIKTLQNIIEARKHIFMYHCYTYGHCISVLFDLSFICVLTSKVRELLIFVL